MELDSEAHDDQGLRVVDVMHCGLTFNKDTLTNMDNGVNMANKR